MSMNFQIVRYNFISQKVRKPLRIVMIADLHNQVYGWRTRIVLTAIDTEQPGYYFTAWRHDRLSEERTEE